MLDYWKKTDPLLETLKAALPFEVELAPAVVEHLRSENVAAARERYHVVSEVSYAGDEGGIMCHIVPPDERSAIVISLTQVRVSRSAPFAGAVIAYQKHRIKKIKKQGGM
jgi:hypothetical protein